MPAGAAVLAVPAGAAAPARTARRGRAPAGGRRGGGDSWDGMLASLPPSPKLQAQLEALPPVSVYYPGSHCTNCSYEVRMTSQTRSALVVVTVSAIAWAARFTSFSSSQR